MSKAKRTVKNKTEKAFQDLVNFIRLPITLKIFELRSDIPGRLFQALSLLGRDEGTQGVEKTRED